METRPMECLRVCVYLVCMCVYIYICTHVSQQNRLHCLILHCGMNLPVGLKDAGSHTSEYMVCVRSHITSLHKLPVLRDPERA